jgi:hypothetical protein
MLQQAYGNEKALDYVRNAKGFSWVLGELSLTVVNNAMFLSQDLHQDILWASSGSRVVAGFDTAFSQGGDKCAITFLRTGRERGSGRVVAEHVHTKVIFPNGLVFEEAVAEAVVPVCIKVGVAPKDFGMDVSGDGGKIAQAIIRRWLKEDPLATDIYLISSSGTPTTRTVSDVDSRKCVDAYDRLISEYWFNIYHALNSKVLLGTDTDSSVVSDLISRRYYYKNKKIAVETKGEMKARLGHSPDEGDSMVYGTIMAMRAGLQFIGSDKARQNERERFREESRRFEPQDEADYNSDSWGEED